MVWPMQYLMVVIYIANPDLEERFHNGTALNIYNRPTFYGGGEAGYTDYQTL
jgi:N-ethylmaleimide reductase